MQELAWSRLIDVGLDGIIRSKKTNDAVECTIHYITEDCMAVVVTAPDPHLCDMEYVEMMMFLPTERSPIKFNGRIVKHSQDDGLFRVRNGYVARVFVTEISRIDMRRLDLVIAQKRAFTRVSRG